MLHSVVQLITLVCDASVSMDTPSNPSYNAPIHDLNLALLGFQRDLENVKQFDVQTMHIRFSDDAQIAQGFESLSSGRPPTYTTFGSGTDYGVALGLAIAEVEERRAVLRNSGLEVNQPWIVFITDGKPNANVNPGFERELLSRIDAGKLIFIPVAVGGSDTLGVLSDLSPKQKPIVVASHDVDDFSFAEFFRWLSDSVQKGSPIQSFAQGGDDDALDEG